MDLSPVPLLVLEKVRNKWEKITSPDDPLLRCSRALCDWQGEMQDVPLCRVDCYACPICIECTEICDTSHGWNERRERFLLGIRAEIERRAAM